MTAYYNEIDPYAAAWLRNLITAGHIAPGIVDERSIEDVYPSDLRGFTQCHFFAGIGVWSHALRRAGWPDDRPVWTGSCPCQPFSAAGKGDGFDDARHLWPAFFHLIRECRPAVVLGEQVASKSADPWIDLVQDDMEGLAYAFGAVAFPSAGVGAPHIRDRTYWVAYATGAGPQGRRHGGGARPGRQGCAVERGGAHGRVAHPNGEFAGIEAQGLYAGESQPGRRLGAGGLAYDDDDRQRAGTIGQLHDAECHLESCGSAGGLADAAGAGRRPERADGNTAHLLGTLSAGQAQSGRLGPADGTGPTNGLWRDADWLLCRDGKWRPVEPGTFPLAHGAASRVGRLRAYGNAINAEAARVFIECVMDCA